MAVIKPSLSGKTYSIWKMLMNYLLFSMDKNLAEDFDPGFRISLINSCWICIESFTKECLYWYIMSNYDKMEIPDEFKYKKGCSSNIQGIGKSKDDIEMVKFNEELRLKEEFAMKAKSSSWYPVLEICNEINMPIEKTISQWEFLQNLYRLRNGLTHGLTIKILKSNFDHLKDEVSKEYIKSIRYLNGKKVVDMKLLIEKQNILDLLNQDVTNFIIDETAKSFDNIAEVFEGSYVSAQWKNMRD